MGISYKISKICRKQNTIECLDIPLNAGVPTLPVINKWRIAAILTYSIFNLYIKSLLYRGYFLLWDPIITITLRVTTIVKNNNSLTSYVF
jgi:hypothetical protein